MSGGQLVVLDRLGRDVKRYLLPEGLATIGSDPACHIRVMLSSVSPHHATVVVHANQTVVRNVSTGETLVNGQPVSVAALRHKDRIELGGRVLRWEYNDAAVERPLAPEPVVYSRGRGRPSGSVRSAGSARSQRSRRASAAAPAPRRSPAVQLRLEMTHRASMPGGVGGKQVAIVQPQRRATAEQNDQSVLRQNISVNNRPRATKSEGGSSPEPSAGLVDGDKSKRKSSRPVTSSPITLQGTTKATLWIESRKSSPRKTVKPATPASAPAPRRRAVSGTKSTPLRLAVLKRHRASLTKIQAPREIDPTKQAAIMLMTGRTPRPPAVLVKRTGSLRLTPKQPTNTTPRRRSDTHSVTLLEINDSPRPPSSAGSRRSPPVLASPKKSALKDPSVKKASRKTDSIKFDLSNLDNYEQSQDVFMVSDATRASSYDANVSSEDENVSLHYDTSSVTPSPRRSIHSRSSRILESTLGTTATGRSSTSSQRSTLTPGTPRNRKSSRGSILVQKVLQNSMNEPSKRYSTRTTKTVSDQSYDTTVESAFRTRTLSPRSPGQTNMESYSIVDLVSADSNDSRSSSVYDSVRSRNSSNAVFGTPQNSIGRKTRSTIDPGVITSSTPYVGKSTARPKRASSSPNISRNRSVTDRSQVSRGTRRSKSLTTPENMQPISLNATRVSRGPRSRSRINDSELLLISTVTDVEDSSPKSSKRPSRNDKSVSPLQNARTSARKTRLTVNVTPSESDEGMNTPENKGSPQEAGTPVLSIQSLLDSSLGSSMSRKPPKKGRMSKRNTIGGIQKKTKGRPAKSKSLNFVVRKSGRRQSKNSSAASNKSNDIPSAASSEDVVTPKSAVKLVPEDVKNKHSTAKKPQSKRSIIDDLNDSDIVKQLFNSPVKRKLSQSMSEYSRKKLFDDVDVVVVRRPTRHTVANSGRTPERSPLERTEAYSPGVFVSPLNTPDCSPNLTGIKRLFENQTSEEDVRGGKNSSRTTRHRRSIKNDLTRISGVKKVFARSPRNRLSNVRVKELFAAPQKDDLSRVSGVKTLFRTKTPNNDLRDVRGVKKLFGDSPVNDLRNVSGVKKMLRRNSPRNDLSDVRGVRKIFRQEKETADGLSNVSGVEELFNESNQSLRGTDRSHRGSNRSHGGSNKSHMDSNRSHNNAEASFDKLIGKPSIKAVYSKTVTKKIVEKPKLRHCKSMNIPVGEITNNLEEWLDRELKKRLQRDKAAASPAKADKSNVSRNVTRELQRLATDTVAGEAPLCISRVRNSTIVVGATNASITHTTITSVQDKSDQRRSASQVYSARKLPIKKRLWPSAGPPGAGLPLKKRSVVHSTPVKGPHGRMDASELSCGRVSPITASDHTAQNALQLISTQRQETEPAKGLTRTKSKLELSKAETPKVSPKKIRTSRAPEQSSAGRKALRTRQTNNAQKQRPSLVVAKKAPTLSPQPGTKATRRKVDDKKMNIEKVKDKVEDKIPVKSPAVTPKKRTTRRQKLDNSKDNNVDISIKTPKRTARGKVQRASLVVRRPSPKMKPIAPKGIADVQPEQSRRTRKATAPSEVTSNAKTKQKTESLQESPKPRGARTRRTADVIAKPKGKQTKVATSPRLMPAKNKPAKKSKETKVEEKSTANNKTRGRKLEKDVEVALGKRKGATLEAAIIKGKKTEPELKAEKAESVKATNTRNRTGQKPNITIEVPKTRGRNAKVTSAQTKNNSGIAGTRGRKTKAPEEVLQESKRSRGKKVETQNNTQIKGKRGQETKIVEDKTVSEVAPTRSKRTKANEVIQEKMTRGKSDKNSTQSEARDQKAKAKVEDKSRKRKSNIQSDIPSKVRKTRNEDMTEAKGRGRKAVEVVKEVKGVKETAKKPVEKMHMTRRRATTDRTTGVEATVGRAGRGRQVAMSSSESQAAGRKRKSLADTSDKAGKGAGRKQPANKKSKVAESPKQRTRGRAAPAEGPKRATRARR